MCMHQNIQSRNQKFKIFITREASPSARHCEQAGSQHGQRPNHSPLRVELLARRVNSVGQLRIPRPLTHINSPLFSLTTHYHLFLNHFRFTSLSKRKKSLNLLLSKKNNNTTLTLKQTLKQIKWHSSQAIIQNIISAFCILF
jgi:hypothetical protein